MLLGQHDLRAKVSMQCLSGLVNEPYFVLFASIGFNFKVLTLGRLGLASHLRYHMHRNAYACVAGHLAVTLCAKAQKLTVRYWLHRRLLPGYASGASSVGRDAYG